jgi:SAM-dependent methyltransferase
VHGIKIVSVLEQLQENDYEVVIALAVFEHLHPHVLRQVLQQLYAITTPDAVIAGAVPTPLGRPILAFLSYRLGLIDPSQIRDHKVYYDDLWLGELLRGSHWCLRQYNTF